MVCHKLIKIKKVISSFPEDVMLEKGRTLNKNSGEEVFERPSESMSKSKKNVIDPETVIKLYGADSVRWFMLSDSPPEEDIQWSDEGISGSYKFIQKIWNISETINNLDLKTKMDDETKIFWTNL